MPVEEQESNTQEQQDEAKSSGDAINSFTKGLAKELGIGDVELKQGSNEKQEAAENAEEAEEAEDSEDLTENETSEDDAEDQEDEDLIPRSKVQPRIDELTATIKRLEQEKDTARQRPITEQDSDVDRLEKMSSTELKTLKRQVRDAQFDADQTKRNDLYDLEDKIENVIRNAPQRLATRQQDALQRAISSSKLDLDNFDEVGQSVWNNADVIFRGSKSLQGSESGQSEAWNMAIDHYKALRKASKSTNNKGSSNLKKQVNNLKKKTSLDSSSIKGNVNKDRVRTLSKKAKSGSYADQEALIKEMLVKPMDLRQK